MMRVMISLSVNAEGLTRCLELSPGPIEKPSIEPEGWIHSSDDTVEVYCVVEVGEHVSHTTGCHQIARHVGSHVLAVFQCDEDLPLTCRQNVAKCFEALQGDIRSRFAQQLQQPLDGVVLASPTRCVAPGVSLQIMKKLAQ